MSTHQILISSYAKDFPWLRPCLLSLKNYCVGFLPPVICTNSADAQGAREICAQVFPEATVAVKDGHFGPLRAQIAMMNGDLLCPNADFTYLVGSDCLVHCDMTPDFYFHDNKPMMLISSYAALGHNVPWKASTERAMKRPVEFEYMRRLPLVYPRALFKLVRTHIETLHNTPFERYVYSTHHNGGNFSESNVMGAYAHVYASGFYHWQPLDQGYVPPQGPLIQFWSHGGLDRPNEAAYRYNGDQSTHLKTPRQVIQDVLGKFGY